MLTKETLQTIFLVTTGIKTTQREKLNVLIFLLQWHYPHLHNERLAKSTFINT